MFASKNPVAHPLKGCKLAIFGSGAANRNRRAVAQFHLRRRLRFVLKIVLRSASTK
jgi:hypothetical protein